MTTAKKVSAITQDWSINILEKVQKYNESFNDKLEEYYPILIELDKMEKIVLLPPERKNLYMDLLRFKTTLAKIYEEKPLIQQLAVQ